MRAARIERLAPWLAAAVTTAGGLWAWLAPYGVEYEMTLLPWLVSKGWVMYRDVVDQHPPLLPVVLAILTGGDMDPPLHVIAVLVHVGVLALTYLVASRIAGAWAGLLALLLAEAWTVALGSDRLWYDSVSGLLYLLVLLLLVVIQQGDRGARVRDRLPYLALAVGVLVALALLTKQQAVVALPFVVVSLLWTSPERVPGGACAGPASGRASEASRPVEGYLGTAVPRSSGGRSAAFAWFALGLAAPLAIAGIALWLQGALGDAWYWIVLYSLTSNYASAAALSPTGSDWWKLAALFAPVIALALCWPRVREILPARLVPVIAGLLLAGSLPAWPRYAGFHLQSAIPILCVVAGITSLALFRQIRGNDSAKRGLALAGSMLVAACAVGGLLGLLDQARLYMLVGQPSVPYAETAPPLRSWVAAHAPASSVFLYGLDPLLYRALDATPPRPWAPQLPWILSAHGTQENLWAGVGRERPAAVLVPASAWDGQTAPGPAYGVPLLRRDYHEAVRFQVAPDRLSPFVNVVGLLRNDNTSR